MVAITSTHKKQAAIAAMLCFLMAMASAAEGASSPAADETAILDFAGRLAAMLPTRGEEALGTDQLADMYAKAELLKSDLAAAAAGQELQAGQNECAFIRSAAVASLLQGTQAVLSFAAAYIRITRYPPETLLQSIRAYVSLARKAVYMAAVAPKALANSILMEVQYWECLNELAAG